MMIAKQMKDDNEANCHLIIHHNEAYSDRVENDYEAYDRVKACENV